MKVINKGYQILVVSTGSMNPTNNFVLEARLCLYNGKPYLCNTTNRYWDIPGMENVIELRNHEGKKIKEVGSNEIEDYGTWLNRHDPQVITDFYNKI